MHMNFGGEMAYKTLNWKTKKEMVRITTIIGLRELGCENVKRTALRQDHAPCRILGIWELKLEVVLPCC